MNKLTQWWLRIPALWRYEITSAVNTFITGCLLEIGLQYEMYGNALPTDNTVLVGIASAVLRAGIKALVTFLITQARQKWGAHDTEALR